MKKNTIINILLILALGVFTSCTNETASDPEAIGGDPAPAPAPTPAPTPTPPPSTPVNVTVEQKSGQADSASVFNIEFTVSFDRVITAATFTTADVTQNGSATGVSWNIINLGNNRDFTLQATAGSDGTYIPSLNAGVVTDPWANNNNASTSNDNSVTLNTGASLSVTVEQKTGQADPVNSTNVEFDVVFSSAIDTGSFTTADITQSGSAGGITWNIVNNGDDINFTLQATAVSSDGTIIPSINAGLVDNAAVTASNSASTSIDNSVTYDATAPNLSITSPTVGTWFGTTLSVSGNCNEASGTVNISVGGTVNDTATCNGTTWSNASINISGLADQTSLTITADLDDTAGNSATQQSVNINKDATAPAAVANVTLDTDDATLIKASQGSWPAASDNLSGVDHYEYALGTTAGAVDIVGYKNIATALNYRAVTTTDFAGDLPEAQNLYISVRVVDVAGNVSSVASSGAFVVKTPATFANNVVWLDGADSATYFTDDLCTTAVAADLDAVGCWQDKSGNANHYIQATATKKPAYRTAMLNGRDTVQFGGDGDHMADADGENYINGNTSLTVVAVIKSNVTSVDSGIFRARTNASESYPFLRYDVTGDNGLQSDVITCSVGAPTYVESSASVQTTSSQLVVMEWASGSAINMYINGSLDTVSSQGATLTGALSGANNMLLGKGPQDGNNSGWDGQIIDFAVYQGTLSAADRAKLESYLNDKWNIW